MGVVGVGVDVRLLQLGHGGKVPGAETIAVARAKVIAEVLAHQGVGVEVVGRGWVRVGEEPGLSQVGQSVRLVLLGHFLELCGQAFDSPFG